MYRRRGKMDTACAVLFLRHRHTQGPRGQAVCLLQLPKFILVWSTLLSTCVIFFRAVRVILELRENARLVRPHSKSSPLLTDRGKERLRAKNTRKITGLDTHLEHSHIFFRSD